MRNIYRRLLLILATATQKELARHVRYLQIENRILRDRLPKRIALTMQERNRLVRFGFKLGKAMNELVTIVHPNTLRRWIREGKRTRIQRVPRGRRPTALEVRRLILRFAKENGWGYSRIVGELRKLGIRSIACSTVKNILRAHGYDPGPKRGVGTWDEFVKIHAATLWQCDFVSKRVLTRAGIREMFLLVFIHVGSRRIHVSPATANPNDAWVQEQADAMLRFAKKARLGIDIVMHDRDTKFTAGFDAKFTDAGGKVQKSPIRSPNIVAYVERVIQTLKAEVLDYFYVFGEKHLNYLVREAVEHYHTERPHQGLDNELIQTTRGRRKNPAVDTLSMSEVRCKTRLGGLLKHYYRDAA